MENFAEILDGVERMGKHRLEMNRIIVQKISNEEKLRQIRNSILKFNAGSEDTETSAKTDDELNAICIKDDLKQTMMSLIKNHQGLVDSINTVLLGHIAFSEKVEQIENLLM